MFCMSLVNINTYINTRTETLENLYIFLCLLYKGKLSYEKLSGLSTNVQSSPPSINKINEILKFQTNSWPSTGIIKKPPRQVN